MKLLIIIGVVLIALFVMAVLWWFGTHNRLVAGRNLIQESWRQIDVELQRRYELIPNLVETVRGFAAHERNTLESVISMRNQAKALASSATGAPTAERAAIEGQLTNEVRNLLVTVEAYPEIKSNQNFAQLQHELVDTEDRIAAGRRYYNANVRAYNTCVESVPSNIVASVGKFEKATYFEVQDPVARQSVQVNFGELAQRPPAEQ